MTHIIVKNGRVAVQNGRVVTSAGGAPCCCGGGSDCNTTILDNQTRFRFDMDAIRLNATLRRRTEPTSGPITDSETQISLQIPSHTFYFGGTGGPSAGQASYAARFYNIEGIGPPVTSEATQRAADWSARPGSQYGDLNVQPIGTIVTTTQRIASPPVPSTTTVTIGEFKNIQTINLVLARTSQAAQPYTLVGVQILLNGCRSIDGGDPQPFDQYIDVFFENSFGNAPVLRNAVNRQWWGEIEVQGRVPFGCGPVSATTSSIAGRRYVAQPGANETQVLLSLGPRFRSGDYSPDGQNIEPFDTGDDDVALFPQSIDVTVLGTRIISENTIDFALGGIVSEHWQDTGDPPYDTGDGYTPVCDDPIDDPEEWPVAQECGGTRTVTYDPADKPADAITFRVGSSYYYPSGDSSTNVPVTGEWLTTPCPSNPCAGLVPNDPRCNDPMFRDCPQCVGSDIGDPDVIPSNELNTNGNAIESHMSPITKCRGCGG